MGTGVVSLHSLHTCSLTAATTPRSKPLRHPPSPSGWLLCQHSSPCPFQPCQAVRVLGEGSGQGSLKKPDCTLGSGTGCLALHAKCWQNQCLNKADGFPLCCVSAAVAVMAGVRTCLAHFKHKQHSVDLLLTKQWSIVQEINAET